MAWEGSTRVDRLPPDWQLRRIRVLRRDGYRCKMRTPTGIVCGAPASEVDHIRPGDDHALTNLRAVCKTCHGKKSAQEGVEARLKKYAKNRPPRPHPGLLPPPTQGSAQQTKALRAQRFIKRRR